MSKPAVSVVVPAFNEEKYIQNALFSLLRSEQKTDINYEVILVDNNSTDKTVQLAQKFKNGMNLRIIKERKQGRGAARARGFKEAKGGIILSADGDTIFYDNWIEELSTSITGDYVAVTTSCKILDFSHFTNFIFNLIQPILMVLYRIFFGHFWLSGFSFGISRSVYTESGGFDTSLQALEDIDLGLKVAKLGKIKFINKPVISSGRRFKKGLLSGIFAYIKTFILAYILKREPAFMGNPR